MRELIERNVFCGVTYQRSVFIDYDGFVIGTTEWTPVTNSYAGGVCGSSLDLNGHTVDRGIIIR